MTDLLCYRFGFSYFVMLKLSPSFGCLVKCKPVKREVKLYNDTSSYDVMDVSILCVYLTMVSTVANLVKGSTIIIYSLKWH